MESNGKMEVIEITCVVDMESDVFGVDFDEIDFDSNSEVQIKELNKKNIKNINKKNINTVVKKDMTVVTKEIEISI